MSVINEVPIIKTILGKLTSTELKTLLSLIDGEGADPVLRTCVPNAPSPLTASDKGVKRVLLEINNPYAVQKLYTGYLVYNDDVCAVISYSNDVSCKLRVITIDSALNCTLNGTSTSVLELRSEINDLLVEAGEMIKVQADDIDSGAATSGQALIANGEGGASWGDVEALPAITAGDEGKALVVSSGVAAWGDAGFSITNLAPAYNSASSYVAGDLCTYNNTLYECVASTTGDFDLTKWSATNIAAAVLGLLNVGV